ncbi:hypothetical protein DVH24_017168 [Malus domestica]|uniref:Uncharacterized protein n=1 Tax=Malus domestica TaxID=3750 RepID=A0A498IV49_MALDO|nr:hypothetical protein DVH24_017168 [Malus domestica]
MEVCDEKSFILNNQFVRYGQTLFEFLNTFSIGPSYLFLLRAGVMEEVKEGTKKKVLATTDFVTGQLLIFISIYYVPLHLALDNNCHSFTIFFVSFLLKQ